MRMLRLVVGESVTLRWEAGKDTWLVKIDAGQIDQILTNLCSNARDAISTTGEVIIRTENVTVGDGTFATSAGIASGEYATIQVADDGVGIEPDIQQRIFEPFFTTKPVGEGSGLGLSVAYGIVKEHGGWIGVESEVGRGSAFSVFLPVEGAAVAPWRRR